MFFIYPACPQSPQASGFSFLHLHIQLFLWPTLVLNLGWNQFYNSLLPDRLYVLDMYLSFPVNCELWQQSHLLHLCFFYGTLHNSDVGAGNNESLLGLNKIHKLGKITSLGNFFLNAFSDIQINLFILLFGEDMPYSLVVRNHSWVFFKKVLI